MNRREFIKTVGLSVGALAANSLFSTRRLMAMTETKVSSNAPILPRREYGKNKIPLSIIGLGGMVVNGVEQDHANRVVAEAVERGVNYFDVAPTYGDAEVKYGPALEPYRKDIFLACKTTQRGREGAAAELKNSLSRLRTDYLDLYQLHALNKIEKDVDTAFAKGGAMEVFVEAKKSGQVRHLGFSSHSTEAALQAMDRYDFDSVLFPVNFACFYKGRFGPEVIKKAQSKGVTLLAIKALARQQWPKDDPLRKKYNKCWYQPLSDRREAELGLRFTLSQPVTAAVPPGDESLFRLAMDLAMDFKPLSAAEDQELRTLASSLNPIFSAA